MFQNRQIPCIRILANLAVIALFHTLNADTHGGDQPYSTEGHFTGGQRSEGKPVKEGWEVVDGMSGIGYRLADEQEISSPNANSASWNSPSNGRLFHRWQQRIEISGYINTMAKLGAANTK